MDIHEKGSLPIDDEPITNDSKNFTVYVDNSAILNTMNKSLDIYVGSIDSNQKCKVYFIHNKDRIDSFILEPNEYFTKIYPNVEGLKKGSDILVQFYTYSDDDIEEKLLVEKTITINEIKNSK